MDFLNQSTAQLRDLFRSMTPGARITSALLLGVVVVSLTWLFRSQGSGPDAFLMGGEPFSASHLPAMEAAFAKANLNGYEIDGNRIRIPRGQAASYMGALADAGALPPNFGSYLEKAMASDSPFLGAKDKQERLKIAKQNELSLILRSMQGIENASVIYDIKQQPGLGRKELATASVNVKPLGSEPLPPERVPMIRNLVAASIAGLARENVTVTDLNGRTYAGSGAGGMGEPADDPYYKLKTMFEKEKQQQIAAQLGMIPGVNVQVNAELDPQLRHSKDSIRYDPKAVVATSDTTTEVENSQSGSPGGRPGVEANSARAQGPGGGGATVGSAASARQTSKELERSREKQQNYVSEDREKIEIKGLTPKRVQVSVVVPSSYYRQVWQTANPPAAGTEPKEPTPADISNLEQRIKKDVEEIVVQLLPPPNKGDDPFPRVSVTTLQSLPQAPFESPTLAKEAVAWVGQYWSTLGMTGLAFFGLLMLRSMVKSVPTPTAPQPAAASAAPSTGPSTGPTLTLVSDDQVEAGQPDEPAANRLKRRIRKGPSLKDDLTDMVREDPDAAASILRNWINNVG